MIMDYFSYMTAVMEKLSSDNTRLLAAAECSILIGHRISINFQ